MTHYIHRVQTIAQRLQVLPAKGLFLRHVLNQGASGRRISSTTFSLCSNTIRSVIARVPKVAD